MSWSPERRAASAPRWPERSPRQAHVSRWRPARPTDWPRWPRPRRARRSRSTCSTPTPPIALDRPGGGRGRPHRRAGQQRRPRELVSGCVNETPQQHPRRAAAEPGGAGGAHPGGAARHARPRQGIVVYVSSLAGTAGVPGHDRVRRLEGGHHQLRRVGAHRTPRHAGERDAHGCRTGRHRDVGSPGGRGLVGADPAAVQPLAPAPEEVARADGPTHGRRGEGRSPARACAAPTARPPTGWASRRAASPSGCSRACRST